MGRETVRAQRRRQRRRSRASLESETPLRVASTVPSHRPRRRDEGIDETAQRPLDRTTTATLVATTNVTVAARDASRPAVSGSASADSRSLEALSGLPWGLRRSRHHRRESCSRTRVSACGSCALGTLGAGCIPLGVPPPRRRRVRTARNIAFSARRLRQEPRCGRAAHERQASRPSRLRSARRGHTRSPSGRARHVDASSMTGATDGQSPVHLPKRCVRVTVRGASSEVHVALTRGTLTPDRAITKNVATIFSPTLRGRDGGGDRDASADDRRSLERVAVRTGVRYVSIAPPRLVRRRPGRRPRRSRDRRFAHRGLLQRRSRPRSRRGRPTTDA
jgi:hypothetical protein